MDATIFAGKSRSTCYVVNSVSHPVIFFYVVTHNRDHFCSEYHISKPPLYRFNIGLKQNADYLRKASRAKVRAATSTQRAVDSQPQPGNRMNLTPLHDTVNSSVKDPSTVPETKSPFLMAEGPEKPKRVEAEISVSEIAEMEHDGKPEVKMDEKMEGMEKTEVGIGDGMRM